MDKQEILEPAPIPADRPPNPPTRDGEEEMFSRPPPQYTIPPSLYRYLITMPLNQELMKHPAADHLIMGLEKGTLTLEDLVQPLYKKVLQPRQRDLLLNVLKFKTTMSQIVQQPQLCRSVSRLAEFVPPRLIGSPVAAQRDISRANGPPHFGRSDSQQQQFVPPQLIVHRVGDECGKIRRKDEEKYLVEKTKYKEVAPTWELNIEQYGYGAKSRAYDPDYEHVESPKYREYERLEGQDYDEEIKDMDDNSKAPRLSHKTGQYTPREQEHTTSDYIIPPKVPQISMTAQAPPAKTKKEHAFELPAELADPQLSPGVNMRSDSPPPQLIASFVGDECGNSRPNALTELEIPDRLISGSTSPRLPTILEQQQVLQAAKTLKREMVNVELPKTNKNKKEVWKVSTRFNKCGKLAKNLKQENDNTHKGNEDNGFTSKRKNGKISQTPTDKCPYEIVRDKNIAEKERRLKDLLADIQNDNKEIMEEIEKRKGKKKERKKAEKVVLVGEPRMSLRAKRKVNYCLDEKDDEFGQKKKRQRTKKTTECPNEDCKESTKEDCKESTKEDCKESTKEDWKESTKEDWEESTKEDWEESTKEDPDWEESLNEDWEESSNEDWEESTSEVLKESTSEDLTKRIPRTGQKPNYAGVAEDEFIFCERCREDKLHGCEIHPLRFDYVPEIDICPSRAGRNGRDAGRGVFNIGSPIPEGVMFGPYEGIKYTKEEYEEMKSIYGESGYAWEVRDEDKEEVVTYVDPGPNPHPRKNWLAIVNMPVKTRLQNMVAVQYKGKIFYLTVQEISHGEEFLVDYGNAYARELGINVDEKDLYEGYENWEEDCVTCSYCKITFANKESLKKHIEKTIGGCPVVKSIRNKVDIVAGVKPYVCEECGKGFKKPSQLKVHTTKHSDETPYQCTECDQWYKTPKQVRDHKRKVHSAKKISCPECNKLFKTKTGMELHLRSICSLEKPFKCDQCGRTFTDNFLMKRHIKTVHSKARPFKCEKCEKRFKTTTSLKVHIKYTHEGFRPPFACEDCGLAYRVSIGLERHRIAKHTFEFKIHCQICEKGFITPYELRMHMKSIHPSEFQEKIEKEQPAKCPKCKKRFATEKQVEIHVQKMHKD